MRDQLPNKIRHDPRDFVALRDSMPWKTDYYPPAMKHLPAQVREKAITIANALLDEGYDEGRAIRIGIAKAKEWAVRHDIPSE